MYRSNPSADAHRISQVLATLAFPAAKWQVVMEAEDYGADAATRAQLWALPTGTYPDLAAVLVAMGLARHAPASPRYRQQHTHQLAGRSRPVR